MAIDTNNAIITIDGTTIDGLDPDSIPFPKGKTGTKDCTPLGTMAMKKGLKILDPGSTDLKGWVIPGDAGQIALKTAAIDRKEHVFTVSIPDAGELITYNALVSADNRESKDNSYLFAYNLEISGLPTRATTYAAITSISCSGAGVSYSPTTTSTALVATDNDIVINEATGIATSTVTVTAAASSSICLSVDGGTTWQTLASGTPSTTPVTLGAAGSLTKALVKVSETAKADRFVRIYIVRA